MRTPGSAVTPMNGVGFTRLDFAWICISRVLRILLEQYVEQDYVSGPVFMQRQHELLSPKSCG